MTDIRRLDEETIARVAAGEVVTDPAAVVVELLDNAVDAGASQVTVELERGGIDAVRVRDDGRGMDPETAPLAFERHATSKIRTAGDLEGVETLGFRGEALAAIAEAATAKLVTRAEDCEAVRVTPDGEVAPAARAVGTTVEVRDLFADRPARRESLASPRREFSKVSDRVAHYALARPDLAVRLDHDGDRVFDTPGSGDYVDAVLGVYDRSVAGQSTAFAHRDGEVTVEGLVCYPSVTRASPDHVYPAVRGRPVGNAAIRTAVGKGYGRLLPGDRHPIAVVDVSVPADRVDVNVHPNKRDVALADEAAVAAAVETAVRDALATEDLARVAEVETDLDESLSPVDAEAASPLSDLTVVGVFRNLYVLCEREDSLLVVDGHAAHERINYERLRAAVRGDDAGAPPSGARGSAGDRNGDDGDSERRAFPSRPVDPPQTVSLSPRTAALVDDDGVGATLSRLGYEVRRLGGGTCRVHAVPAPLGRAADPTGLREVLESIAEDGDPGAALDDDVLADLACHPSLKAGEVDEDLARTLLDGLAACDRPFACPHGRPTVLSVAETTLARGFDREHARMDP